MKKVLIIIFSLACSICSAQKIDSLRAVLNGTDSIERVMVLHQLIFASWLNETDEALNYAREAVTLSEKINNPSIQSKSLRLLGGVYSYRNIYELALTYNYESLNLALNNQDSVNISASYNNLGHININLGNYPDALEYLLRAKTIKERLDMQKNLPLAFNNIGRVYYEMKDYLQSEEYFLKGLDKAKGINDKNQTIYSLNNLGYTYLKLGNTMQAYKRFKESIMICKDFENKNWQSVAFRGMGITFLQDKQYDSAQLCFVKSIKLSSKIEDQIGLTEAYYQQAQLEQQLGNIDKSLRLIGKAQRIAEAIGTRKHILDNLQLYMDIHRQQDQMKDFEKYQKRYTNFKDSILHESTRRIMSLIPLKLKNEETSLSLIKKQAQLERTKFINRQYAIIIIIVVTLLIVLARLYLKYRKANKVLKTFNYEIAAQKEEIQTQNEELTQQGEELRSQREKLAEVNQLVSVKNDQLKEYATTLERKVDHRSGQLAILNKDLLDQNLKMEQFNYVTVHNLREPIAQLLGLMSIIPREALDTDSGLKSIVGKMKNSVEDLDVIVRDLNVILSIRKGTPDKIEKVSFNEELNTVVQSLRTELNDKDVDLILPKEVINAFTIKNYLRNILHNLIYNAIKFSSSKRKPVIKITMQEEQHNVKILVEDNGIGIDMQYAKSKIFKLYQRFNTDYQGKGLGLYIVKNQIEAMEGFIKAESELDEFTKFTIILPKRN